MHKRILLILGLTFLPLSFLNAAALKRGPYLQNGSTTAVTVRWRTDVNTETVVHYGTSAGNLSQRIANLTKRTEHEVRITGLQPDTKYFYSVGDADQTLEDGTDCFFITAPTGAKPTRVWLLGDPGTGTIEQKQVRDAYYKFTGSRHTDLWLMDGDNAMNNGNDWEYTSKLFAVYPDMLKKSVLWTAYGNHDAGCSDALTQTGPYFEQHTFPKNGEAGGVPSGSEAYYSFDYGNIHFVILDTSESSRLMGSPQLQWLEKDLAANKKDWTIVIFHHPIYTRGTEHSDKLINMREARQNMAPVMEAHGVDLVVSGHAHCYQRSCFLNGHYGMSSTFDKETMVVQKGNGRIGGDGAYLKDMSEKAFSGTVYLVAGASGKVGGDAVNHPVMLSSMSVLGSLVMDFNGPQLDVQYIDRAGARRDHFTIKKINLNTEPTTPPAEPPPAPPPANKAPSVQITSPAANVSLTAPSSLTISAQATDVDGSVQKVEFLAGGTVLSTDTASPYSYTWNNVPAGAQTIVARAIDNAGASATSSSVLVNVTAAPVVAQAVTSFTLMDAATNQPVPGYETITAGQTIYRSKLPSSLSVRVNTNPAKVGSVKIGWNGNANYRTETLAPYELFGGPAGDTYGGTIANGTHTFTGTPYTEASGKGTAGTSASVTFTIVDGAPPAPAPEPEPAPEPAGNAVVSFTLMDADTNRPIAGYEAVQDGAVIVRGMLPTKNLSVRVNTNPAKVGSVRIGWNGNANYRTETLAPYELFGGPVGDTYGGTIANGTHTFTGTPYTEAGAKGTAGTKLSVTFTITDQAVPAPAPAPEAEPAGDAVTSFTLMNADTNKPIAGYENIANGAVISRAALPTTRLSVRVNTSPATVGSVRIGWNGNANYRTESLAPYELFGGPVGDTYGGTIANGTHTFTGTPFSLGSGKGSMGTSATVTFTIK